MVKHSLILLALAGYSSSASAGDPGADAPSIESLTEELAQATQDRDLLRPELILL